MSREVDLYKDKIEVSLDGRQIFYLFFGGAVIVGLVFVLGVMVGRRVEARGHVDRANVTTTADPLAALDRLESGNRLSFQDSLRGNTTPENDVDRQIAAMKPAAPGAPAKKGDQPKVEEPKNVAKKDEAKAEKKDDAKTEKKDEAKAEKKDEAKAEAKAEKKDEAKTEAKVDKKVDDKAKTDGAKIEAKADKKTDDKAKTDGAKTDAKIETKKTDDKAKTETVAKAEKTDSEKKADGDKKTDGEKKQKFTLQLSSFQDENEAQAYLDSVKASGYSAYVTKGDVDGKQFFRVRMGSYKSMDAANEAKSEFEKSAKKSAIVTKL